MTLTPLALLVCSNIFMTLAWYGHLKFPDTRLWIVVLASWGIAFIEYCFVIPANRIGYLHGWTLGQLKITQEIVTLVIFALFAALVMGEPLGWRFAGAFACMIGAACFMFVGKA